MTQKHPAKKKNGRKTARRPAKRPKEKTISYSETREIVHAIRNRRVDALVVAGQKGEEVVLLEGADSPYRVLFDTINDGAATLDSRGTVLYANKRFLEILNLSSENFVGTSLQSHFSAFGQQAFETLIGEALKDKSQGEIALDGPGERQRLVRFSLNPLRYSNRQHICVVATELTELLEANRALKSNEESLRQLSARVLRLQDEERRRIARDLHDITGQNLAVQAMMLSRLEQASTNLDEESRKTLAECRALNGQVSEEIRTVSYLLHPPLLDELGLASAVKWYAEGFSRRSGIQTQVDISSDFLRLPPDVEVTLFRIVQESLTNVHRYSGSVKAYVRVKSTDEKIVVEVGDFGRGIRHDTHGTAAPIGVGIQGMRERMRQLSGTLEITSRKNKGTIVTATLPMIQTQVSDSEESAAPEAEAPPQSRQSFAQKRVLIADDHEMLRRGLCNLLQTEMDIDICGEAANGQQAVEMSIELQPDLVIIDIDMPVLNGLAATRQILRHRPQTKVLIFTVHESDQVLTDIRATGAHGCLSKEKGREDLLLKVRELLGSDLPASAARTNGVPRTSEAIG